MREPAVQDKGMGFLSLCLLDIPFGKQQYLVNELLCCRPRGGKSASEFQQNGRGGCGQSGRSLTRGTARSSGKGSVQDARNQPLRSRSLSSSPGRKTGCKRSGQMGKSCSRKTGFSTSDQSRLHEAVFDGSSQCSRCSLSGPLGTSHSVAISGLHRSSSKLEAEVPDNRAAALCTNHVQFSGNRKSARKTSRNIHVLGNHSLQTVGRTHILERSLMPLGGSPF